MNEKVNLPSPAAEEAALARALFEKGVFEEADFEVERADSPDFLQTLIEMIR